MRNTHIYIGWDGTGQPLQYIKFDEEPEFVPHIFCFSPPKDEISTDFDTIYQKTEFKGESVRAMLAHAAAIDSVDYFGIIDDDVEISISAINFMLRDAKANDISHFAATLTPDSYSSYKRFIQQEGSHSRQMHWIEQMAPFYHWDIAKHIPEFSFGTLSLWGVDQFAIPAIQRLEGLSLPVVYDCVAMRHNRPVTSNERRFSNGLNAMQERKMVRAKTMAIIRSQRPELVGTRWWKDTFAPLNGPASFWGPRFARSRPDNG